MRSVQVAVVLFFVLSLCSWAGGQLQHMPAGSFEVATIKPSDPKDCCARTYSRTGRTFSTYNTSLKWLMKYSYGLQDEQIVGGPIWLDGDRYNVTAETEGTKPLTDEESRAALRELLLERFKLALHHESREMPAYVVTVARGGPKLTKSDPLRDAEKQLGFSGDFGQTMRGYARDATLHDFFGELQRLALDRPVVDRTGITGTFNIVIQFTRERPAALGMETLPDEAAPNVFDALNQQLGLKLERAKALVDVVVIDNAEPPSPN